jgi:hypothetical protein
MICNPVGPQRSYRSILQWRKAGHQPINRNNHGNIQLLNTANRRRDTDHTDDGSATEGDVVTLWKMTCMKFSAAVQPVMEHHLKVNKEDDIIALGDGFIQKPIVQNLL